jgi:hypothetical protein
MVERVFLVEEPVEVRVLRQRRTVLEANVATCAERWCLSGSASASNDDCFY